MVSSRDGASKGLNGFDPNAIGEGANAPDGSSPQLAGLVDELAQALGVARESFNERRAGEPTPVSAVQTTPSPASTLPVAIGRHLFDDEEDDAHMPIPSSWRTPPEPPKKAGSFNDQLRAAGLGFATGLALVVPVVLLLTGKLGDLPFSNTLQTTPAKRATASTTYSPPATFPASVLAPPSAPVPSTPSATATVSVAPPAPSASSSMPSSSSPALPGTLVQAPPQRNVLSAAVAPPKVEPEPPPPPVPAPSWTDAIAEGKQRILAGDIVGARDALSKAAAAENAEALLILAETYDPNMLAAWGARGATADVAVAKSLYSRALAGGVDHARARIRALE